MHKIYTMFNMREREKERERERELQSVDAADIHEEKESLAGLPSRLLFWVGMYWVSVYP